MNYRAWDEAIEAAISSLPQKETRSQRLLALHPKALSTFRASLAGTSLAKPLAPFQQHPTYLLRYLLAEWEDADKKPRENLDELIGLSTERLVASQAWRAGKGECWKTWGFKDMDDMYKNYKTASDMERRVNQWYPQRFFKHDKTGHPVHYELMPNTYEKDLIPPMTIRRIVNNEHTLRHRVPLLNAPPTHLGNDPAIPQDHLPTDRPDALSRPILGVTWIIDGRRLSLWSSSAIYKTGTQLLQASTTVTSAHYPEQGNRAIILNLGSVWMSFYNLAMKLMPASTQSTTKCYVGRDELDSAIGWDSVPKMFQDDKVLTLTEQEIAQAKADDGPFVV
ncbi:hypothetical protein BCR37DRAFT_70879 [Protomyces lactucae-debilis]|uniref:CRAL-TRIO domain-containing protein n=1 Tax=Protomyces lactucae-debilis TaxID=2754530 RepID=A0A1Y2FAK0_PROLT|nr:uncharacterized protein BCR37DRAFT_70879 [Protomyces lactucae-debilis]ORY80474.1 hypothetical protein BCR37DRAFT_70879 [Protomyces lactucae-debilis]